jgi:hypothetical protein
MAAPDWPALQKKNEWPVGVWPRLRDLEPNGIKIIAERSAMRSEWLVHLMRAFPTGAVSRRRE